MKRRKDASPLNNVVPPPEHRFQPGNRAAVGHGRPRKLKDLQDLILDVMAEDTGAVTQDGEGRAAMMTRARLMIRTMLNKSPSDRIALLEYAFGKMPNVHEIKDWREIARRNGIDPERVSEAVEQFREMIRGAEVKQILPSEEDRD